MNSPEQQRILIKPSEFQITAVEHPPKRSSLEWIGDKNDQNRALALIHEGIPLDEATQQRIFVEIFPKDQTPTLDYIDLATDEIAPDPNDISGIYSKYEKKVSRIEALWGKVTLRIMGKLSNNAKSFINQVKKTRERNLQVGENSDFLFRNRQLEDFTIYVSQIFENKPIAEYTLLMKTLKGNPEKPFLIINSHGGSVTEEGVKKWIVGEKPTDNYTYLEQVFTHMNIESGKYSAVLLVACNKAHLRPPLQGNTPIFYVDGLTGFVPRRTE